jgi:predicted AAA+ superfamily ATPase
MQFKRRLDLKRTVSRKSTFLLGPRSVGKTTLYETQLKPSRVYDLLDTQTLRKLSLNPERIFEEASSNELIVIDEVQKIPEILNEVQRTIQKKNAVFLLTGSSARKLKRTQANLLGGRATQLHLGPLHSREIPEFDLLKYLNHGGIPRHYLCNPEDLQSELEDYCALYLKEEIKDEALTRDLRGFARFLEIMGHHCGDEIVLENFASDCQIKVGSFRNYLEILQDTLLGFTLPPYLDTKNRKAITRSKFFLFDVGIANHLAQRSPVQLKSDAFGKAFEHFITLEVRAYLSELRRIQEMTYWRSTSQFEVDLVLARKVAIEIKASSTISSRHFKGLNALAQEKQGHDLILVCLEKQRRKAGQIEVLPYRDFLNDLWSGRWS